MLECVKPALIVFKIIVACVSEHNRGYGNIVLLYVKDIRSFIVLKTVFRTFKEIIYVRIEGYQFLKFVF